MPSIARNHLRPLPSCDHYKIWCFDGTFMLMLPPRQPRFPRKTSRGFRPVKTQSLHWIQHPEFEQAIQQFLTSERQHIDRYFSACDDHTPFKALDDEIIL